MKTIKATVQGGRLELDAPSDWPDGTPVEIHRLAQEASGDSEVMSPEEIARTLAAMDQIEPLDWSEEERAAWEAERQGRKEREKAQFVEHLDQLGVYGNDSFPAG